MYERARLAFRGALPLDTGDVRVTELSHFPASSGHKQPSLHSFLASRVCVDGQLHFSNSGWLFYVILQMKEAKVLGERAKSRAGARNAHPDPEQHT